MNIGVPSRFACLKLEEDETTATATKETSRKKNDKVQENGKKSSNSNSNQKKKQNAKKEKKVQQQMQKQWEEWKAKDDKLVVGSYEQDLESALLLSKLHFEENKDKYVIKISDEKKGEKKNKKPKAMSLDQFLAPKDNKDVKEDIKPEGYDKDFFDRLQSEAKKQMNKEQVTEQRKQRETAIEEIITSAQYHEKLEVEKRKNKDLEKQLVELKEQMSGLRSRNQTLCTMLSTGEMKAKAEVLLELEKLNQIKNDLTEEVARLHGLLEQERSKVASLTSDTKHKKGKKALRS